MSGNKWIEPIEEFNLTQRNLPHMQSPGSYYFTTSNTWQRRELDGWERDLIFETMLLHNGTKYILEAAVVMPDHFHLILKPLLKGENSYYSLAEIFHSIKSYTAKQIAARDRAMGNSNPAPRVARAALGTSNMEDTNPRVARAALGTSNMEDTDPRVARAALGTGQRRKRGVRIYQDENYDHIIRNERDYNEKLNYLVMNPVQAGLVGRPKDYRWLYCPSIGKVAL